MRTPNLGKTTELSFPLGLIPVRNQTVSLPVPIAKGKSSAIALVKKEIDNKKTTRIFMEKY